jgi:hypothetical protein
MSNRTFERAVLDWLEDGSDQTPRPALDAVLLAVKTTPQERGLRIPWRFFPMPVLSRATAVATVAVLAVVSAGGVIYVNSNRSGGPGGSPSAPPSPTQPPTTVPTASHNRMQVLGDRASWTVALPAGWSSGGWFLTTSIGPSGPKGIGVVATGAVNVPSDPCDGVGAVSDAKAPADVIADLKRRDDLTVSSPTAASIGGYSGLQVDVEFPNDLSRCGAGAYVIFAEPDGSGFQAQGPSNRMRIWVLDVEGRPIVFLVQSFAATPAADLAAAQEIVDSIVITP